MENKERQERYAYWADLIEEHKKVGGLQSEFCKARNISSTKMSYYRSELKKKELKDTGKQNTVTPISLTRQESSHKLHHQALIKITLPNGFSCEIPSDFSVVQVKSLMGALLSC